MTREDKTRRLSLTAGHVIFANVDAEVSPAGRAGFQTVFCTESRIDENVLPVIEPLFQYSQRGGYAPDELPPEYLFLKVNPAQVFVARITPDLLTRDKAGRNTVLFVHGLLFHAKEFLRKINANPFAVIDSDPFVKDYESVIRQCGGTPTVRNIPESKIRIIPQQLSFQREAFPTAMSDPTFRRMIALGATTSQKTPQRVLVAAEYLSFLDFARSLFAILPARLRLQNSFDTAAVSDVGTVKNPSTPVLWNAVASRRIPRDWAGVQVSLKTEEDWRLPPPASRTPFLIWLDAAKLNFTDPSASESICRKVNFGYEFHRALLGKGTFSQTNDELVAETFEEFLYANYSAIKDALFQNFCDFPGEVAAASLTESAMEWIRQDGPPALASVSQRFLNWQICQWLW
ncbi:MAG: hypothetical protein ABGZ35_11945, partial [Planctomycetaceae bacterium]